MRYNAEMRTRGASRKRKGFALILAVAVSMVCFLIVTATLSMARFDMSSGVLQELSAKRYFWARGQVQELVALINSGEIKLEDVTQDHPHTVEMEGTEVTAWVAVDPENPGVCSIIAQAGDQRSQGALTVVDSRVASAMVAVTERGNPQRADVHGYLYKAKDGWKDIGAPPRVDPNWFAGSTQHYEFLSGGYYGDDQGRWYVAQGATKSTRTNTLPPTTDEDEISTVFRYNPDDSAWEELCHLPLLPGEIAGGYVVDRTGNRVYQSLGGYDLSHHPTLSGHQGNEIMALDLENGNNTWTTIQPPPAWVYRTNDPYTHPTTQGTVAKVDYVTPLSGSALVGVVDVLGGPTGENVVAEYDGDRWRPLPMCGYNIKQLASGPDDEIYALVETRDGEGMLKFERDSTNWTFMGNVPFHEPGPRDILRISVDSKGNLLYSVAYLNNQAPPQYWQYNSDHWDPAESAPGPTSDPYLMAGGAGELDGASTLKFSVMH